MQPVQFLRFTVVVCALGIAGASVRGQDQEDLVGTAGDLSHAQIDGCKVISADVVRTALAKDPRVQTFLSPSAPLPTLLGLVDVQLDEAYRGAGFPNAHISAGLDAAGRHLLIQVDEGRRYLAGPVRVEGGHLLDAKALAEALTKAAGGAAVPVHIDTQNGNIVIPTWERPDDQSDPQWDLGQPADLAYARQSDNEDCVIREMCVQGFCWAHVRLDPKLLDDGTAQLVIHVGDEGPRATLGDVQVLGLKINTPDDVLKFTGLQPGMPINLTTLLDVRRKLWESGRFLKHEIRAGVSASDPGHMKLTLDLMEYPHTPPLSQPLDPAQAAAVRCALWVQQALDTDAAFVLDTRGNGGHMKIVVQNRRGGVFSLSNVTTAPEELSPATQWATVNLATTEESPLRDSSGPMLGVHAKFASGLTWTGVPSDLTLVLVPHQPTLYSVLAGRSLKMAGNFPILLYCDMVPEEKRGPDDGPVTDELGMGLLPRTDDPSPAVKFECSIAPVAFVNLVLPLKSPAAGGAAVKVETKDGVMTITSGHRMLRTDLASGRLIDLEEYEGLTISVEPGGLDREAAACLAAAPKTNDYDPEHPYSSAAAFFKAFYGKCPILAWQPLHAGAQPAEAVIGKLLAAQVLEPLDMLTTSDLDYATNFSTHSAPPSSPLAILRQFLYVVDKLYPHGSWPWTIGHEVVMVVSGGSPFVGRELDRIGNDPDTGPIGCAVLAAIVASKDAAAARALGRAGLQRLSADHFRSDWLVLVGGEGVGPQIAGRLLQSVADLSDADFAVLKTTLAPDWIDALQYVRQAAKDHPGRPVVQTLGDAPEKWWDQALRKPVEELLEKQAALP